MIELIISDRVITFRNDTYNYIGVELIDSDSIQLNTESCSIRLFWNDTKINGIEFNSLEELADFFENITN